MSRREIECSARGTTLGSAIGTGIVTIRAGLPAAHMRPLLLSLCVLLLLYAAPATLATAASPPDPLERARTLYNQRDFDAALEAAGAARRTPALAASADLIAARAYLEKFRETTVADDLAHA